MGNDRYLLHAVIKFPAGIGKLKVVNNKKLHPVFHLQTSGFRAHFKNIQTRRVVYVNGSLCQLPHRFGEPGKIIIGQFTGF
ncbi:MAG: hypothetical protein NT149_02885 [Candidatus Gottesmanbacteria bacterium]|nr:hypothetical protein [Candidatus Gottesmanbacteria bacterium]